MQRVHIGIDASNIRWGGGLVHLAEILKAARMGSSGNIKVKVWGSEYTLSQLPKRDWLELIHEIDLDKPLPWRVFWQLFKLPSRLDEDCDVLFTPGATLVGTDVCPVVTFSQNMLPFDKGEAARYGLSWMRLRYLLLRVIQSKSFKRANGIIFLTEYARSRIMSHLQGQMNASVVIPHGISDRFRLQPREQKDITNYDEKRPFRLLYVSNVTPYKHQWHVADAVGELRLEGVPLKIDFVGGGYGPAQRRLKEKNDKWDIVQSFMVSRGYVDFSELTEYYHRADAFVYASSCENLPNILLEAMAAGLPIACSDREPMPQVLAGGGVYFDPEDSLDIKRCIFDLISNPSKREEISRIAYSKALSYTWERCSQDTFAFLLETAKRVS